MAKTSESVMYGLKGRSSEQRENTLDKGISVVVRMPKPYHGSIRGLEQRVAVAWEKCTDKGGRENGEQRQRGRKGKIWVRG